MNSNNEANNNNNNNNNELPLDAGEAEVRLVVPARPLLAELRQLLPIGF